LKIKEEKDQIKVQYHQAQAQLGEQKEAITKLIQQVIVLERSDVQGGQKFNSMQNLLVFDKSRKLQLENENSTITILSMERDVERLQRELKEKKEEIGKLVQVVHDQKVNQIKTNSEMIRIRVQIDMGNYKELVYNQRRGNGTSGAPPIGGSPGYGQDYRLYEVLAELEDAKKANIHTEELLKDNEWTLKEK
jgi:hypothetical protein